LNVLAADCSGAAAEKAGIATFPPICWHTILRNLNVQLRSEIIQFKNNCAFS